MKKSRKERGSKKEDEKGRGEQRGGREQYREVGSRGVRREERDRDGVDEEKWEGRKS